MQIAVVERAQRIQIQEQEIVVGRRESSRGTLLPTDDVDVVVGGQDEAGDQGGRDADRCSRESSENTNPGTRDCRPGTRARLKDPQTGRS